MRINPINNNKINFGCFLSKAQIEAKNLRRLAKTAEEKLQSRLVNFEDLMIDFETGNLKVMKTGEDFTGKFVIPVPDGKFERLFVSKNGRPEASLVRMKNCPEQKQWAIRKRPTGDIVKEFNQTGLSKAEEEKETVKMIEAAQQASEQMHDNYVIKKLLESGQDSIILHTKY